MQLLPDPPDRGARTLTDDEPQAFIHKGDNSTDAIMRGRGQGGQHRLLLGKLFPNPGSLLLEKRYQESFGRVQRCADYDFCRPHFNADGSPPC
jgi:hypothetical protein